MASPATVPNPAQATTPPAAAPQTPPQAPAQPQTTNPDVNSTIPTEQTQSAPTVLVPEKRGGLGGLVDEIRNALSPATQPQVYRDPETGQRYVQTPTRTGGQQWMRLAADAVQGAVRGYAAGQGAGHQGQAALAGLAGQEAQDKQQAQAQNAQADEDYNIARQNRIDKANAYIQQVKLATAQFQLQEMQHEAGEQDIKFSQDQEDREKNLGSVDLGVYPDHMALADVKKVHPEFWKDAVQGNVVSVPSFDADGKRNGVHLFLRTPGLGDQAAPPGTQAVRFVPGKTPSDPPTLEPFTPTGTHTQRDIDTYNAAAYSQMQAWEQAQAKSALTKAQTEEAASGARKNLAEAAEAPSVIARNNAAASKDRADTAVAPAAGSAGAAIQTDIAQGLASGQYLMGKDIPLRTSKDQATAAQYTAQADQYSREHYGLPYSPEIIRQESHFAEAPKTQALLNGIDRMVGVPGGTEGQLDQVLRLARQAGVSNSNATINEARLAIKKTFGDTAVKNFEQVLSDTQTSLGTLIGNPLLGSGESDKKLQTAKDQFGSNVTLANLQGAVQNSKEILNRTRETLARNNRYIQQRYGQTYSPARQSSAVAPPPGATNEVHQGGPNGPLIGHIVNGRYVPLAGANQ